VLKQNSPATNNVPAAAPPPDLKLEASTSKPPIIRAYYRPFVFGAIPINILNIVFTFIFYPYLPPVVPLFNTLVEAADRLADKPWIFILPIFATVINLIHALVIYFGRKYDVALLQVFDYLTIFIQALLLAVLLRTVLIVI
jgi:hypothetical protein